VITIPTVLILGAGASCPYGFPTAKELKRLICEAFSGSETLASVLLGALHGCPPEKFFEFREAFLKSGVPSVDAFLLHRTDFLEVGKLAIAYCLIPFENEANLYVPSAPAEDWYEYLSERLNVSFENFGRNALSIITFNYDRSLEHYLFTSLQNLFGRSVDECIEKLAEIPLIHVYGQLGTVPYPRRGCRPYEPLGKDVTKLRDTVLDAAHGITLLHERESDLREAHDLLRAARTICFLGFSYHELNVYRLAINAAGIPSKDIFGTALGMIGREVSDIQGRVREALGSPISLIDADNLYVLRQNLILG
jgi:hypothetical protein